MCCSAPRAKRSKRPEATTKPRRPQKNKLTGLSAVGWFLKKIPGLVSFFPPRFFLVFFYSPHRKTPKNVINKSRKSRFRFVVFFLKKFSTGLLANIYVCGVFGLPLPKKTRTSFIWGIGSSKVNQILRRLWTCHRMWAPAAGYEVFPPSTRKKLTQGEKSSASWPGR
jgi:hypothetical protein